MAKLSTCVRTFLRREDGATMVEYGLMVVFIAAASAAIVTTLGISVQGVFTSFNGSF
jgi:Flp pilus assembly pilin Flp